jgi:Ser/Thr protein kinase RdoA (MazF antagonist)
VTDARRSGAGETGADARRTGAAETGADSVHNRDLLGSGAGLWEAHIRMSEHEAARLVETHWELSGRVTRVDTEKDDTFVIDANGDSRYVFKVSNPDESVQELDFEVQLIRHVTESSTLVPVPRVFSDRAGRLLVPIVDDAGQPRHARLMSYISGTPLDSTGSSPAERAEVGRTLAHLRHVTGGFTHPAQHRVLAWDVQHLPSLTPLLAAVTNPAQRDLLEAGLSRFKRITPLLPALRRQVLHNDFSKSNIIVDHDSDHFVQGIIDFGDAVYTAIAVDVATALLNQLPRHVPDNLNLDLFAEGRDVLRGYLNVAELTDVELATIPYLVMGRVIARALITLQRAAAMPSNARYILRNTAPGWAQLRWLLRQSDEHLETLLLPRSQRSARH